MMIDLLGTMRNMQRREVKRPAILKTQRNWKKRPRINSTVKLK